MRCLAELPQSCRREGRLTSHGDCRHALIAPACIAPATCIHQARHREAVIKRRGKGPHDHPCRSSRLGQPPAVDAVVFISMYSVHCSARGKTRVCAVSPAVGDGSRAFEPLSMCHSDPSCALTCRRNREATPVTSTFCSLPNRRVYQRSRPDCCKRSARALGALP